jgi:hypothetical protein
MLQPGFFAAGLDHVPDDVLRDSFAPHLAVPRDGSEDSSWSHTGCFGPIVQGHLDPPGNGDGADVTTLADKVHDSPVPLPHLRVIQPQPDQL